MRFEERDQYKKMVKELNKGWTDRRKQLADQAEKEKID